MKKESTINNSTVEGVAMKSDIEISFHFCPSGFPLGVTGSCMHQRLWHESEEEEQKAVKRFLTIQLLAGGRKMTGEQPRKSDVSLRILMSPGDEALRESQK